MRHLRTSGTQFLLALVLALALWTFVSFTTNPTAQRPVPVPVNIIPPSEGLVTVDPISGLPQVPQVTTTLLVAGPTVNLQQLIDSKTFTATADLSMLSPGTHSVNIQTPEPRGARIRAKNPATVQVRVVPKATKNLPVEGRTEGQLPFIFDQTEPIIVADQVVANGPQNLLTRVEKAIAPINLQGRLANSVEQVKLIPVDRQGKQVPGITLEPDSTNVTITLEARVGNQRVSVLPRFTGEPAPGYRTDRIDWNPKFIEVLSQVPISSTLETEPIDLSDRSKPFTQTVKVKNPDESIIRLLTDSVTVNVPIIPFQLPQNYPLIAQVTPANLGPGLEADAQPRSVTITVSGTFEQLSQVAGAPPRATVDLTGRPPGTYTLPVTVELPPALQIVGEPPEVIVTITDATPTTTPPPEGG